MRRCTESSLVVVSDQGLLNLKAIDTFSVLKGYRFQAKIPHNSNNDNESSCNTYSSDKK